MTTSRAAPLTLSSTAAVEKKASSSSFKVPAQRLVRTDATAQTLDAMFAQVRPTASETRPILPSKRKALDIIQVESDDEATGTIDNIDTEMETEQRSKFNSSDMTATAPSTRMEGQQLKRTKLPISKCDLTSIQELRLAVSEAKHEGLEAIVKQHTFVGTIDLASGQSLIQHGTKLYLVNHNLLCDELFYQLGLRSFSNLGRLHLKPPPSLRELLEIAVENEPSIGEAGVSPKEVVRVSSSR